MSHPVYVLGARGLLAGEWFRLLEAHPALHLAGAFARNAEGTLGAAHPHLGPRLGRTPLRPAGELVDAIADAPGEAVHAAPSASGAVPHGCPVLLLALPHGASGPWWAEHGAAVRAAAPALRVVDLSADFRLQSAGAYADAYDQDHPCPDQLHGAWTYGLPELHPVAETCTQLAAPGCFATALQLATVPFARAHWLDFGSPWILHGVTGSSGSGATPKPGTHHPHRALDFHAYALHGHRHEAELRAPRNFAEAPTVDFTPHSAPLSRGIHLHAVLPLAAQVRVDATEVGRFLHDFCADHVFLEATAAAPQLRHVAGSNRAQLHAYPRGDRLHVLVALDNTLKGGAGQALQCLNRMLSLPEDAGLPAAGLGY